MEDVAPYYPWFVHIHPVAQAQTPFDFTECLAGTSTLVFDSKEIRIGSTEGKGIIFSHHENKVFDNCTFHVVSIAKSCGWKKKIRQLLEDYGP